MAPNQQEKRAEILKKFKGIDIPETIREDEAHLTHIAVIKSVPNVNTMEFDNTVQIVKLNEQALETTKDHFARYGGVIFVLHDGNQYSNENKTGVISMIPDAETTEAEKTKAEEDAKKDALIKEQADKIAKFEAAEKEANEKAKAEKDAAAKTVAAEKEATENKKTNGKG